MARVISAIAACSPLLLLACQQPEGTGNALSEDILLPVVADARFVAGVDNAYFPLPIGATWVYEATTPDAVERVNIAVLEEPRVIEGVEATVVRDTVTVEGEVKEDTFDWYAQDSEGNVWYLGEDTCEYEGGECVNTEGSWEWGVAGASPGIIMYADPERVAGRYYQEFYEGYAEDVGEVVDVDVSADVPAGAFDGCIKTRDTSTLDLTLDENKYYCRGVGVVLVEEPDATERLVEFAGL